MKFRHLGKILQVFEHIWRAYLVFGKIFNLLKQSLRKVSMWVVARSVTRKKSPNVSKSCRKMISLEKWLILTPLQKLPKNVGFLGKLIVAKGFKKLPKFQ